MKKIVSLLLTMLLICSFAACQKKEHTHTFSEAMDADATSHFFVCECGEKKDAAAHSLVDGRCSVCHAEIAEQEDGIVSVSFYDENGVLKSGKRYENDRLAWEGEYAVGTDGYAVEISGIDYFEDGSKIVYTNNKQGYIETQTFYNKEGKALSVTNNEYEFDGDGNVTIVRSYTDNVLTGMDEYKPADDGINYLYKNTSYNADGTTTVTEYNELGEVISEVTK